MSKQTHVHGFGARLREAIDDRAEEGVTIASVARDTGINRRNLHHYLSGFSENPTGTVLIALCEALDCSADYLLGLEG